LGRQSLSIYHSHHQTLTRLFASGLKLTCFTNLSHYMFSLSYHIFSLCCLSNLVIHNSLTVAPPSSSVSDSPAAAPTTSHSASTHHFSPSISLPHSFTPGSKPTSFTNLSHRRLSSSLFFGSVRQTKLAIRQILGARKYSLSYRIVSYCIVSYPIPT